MGFRLMIIIVAVLIAVANVLSATESGCRVDVVESNAQSIIVDIHIDSIAVIQKQIHEGWFTEISYPRCVFTDTAGLPKLPLSSVVLGIPPQGVPRLSILNVEQSTRSFGQIEVVEYPQYATAEMTVDESLPVVYDGNWYPASTAVLGNCGYIRDQRIAQLEIHPVQYNPQTQITRITKSIRLRLEFDDVQSSSSLSMTGVKRKRSKAFESFLQRKLPNYERAKAWRQSPAPLSALEKQVSSTSVESYKIILDSDGIFVLTGLDLKEAGANLRDIDLRTLCLKNKGDLIPFMIEGEGDGVLDEDDRIIFIGEFNRGDYSYLSPYTSKNVYWLSWGGEPGLRFAEVSGLPTNESSEYAEVMRSTIHMERDDDFQQLKSIPNEYVDHWFWQPMGSDGVSQFELPVITPAKTGYATIRVNMRGLTYFLPSPDHHVVVKLNGTTVGDAIWDNQNDVEIENRQVPASILQDGNNLLTFEFPLDLEVDEDRALLNWIEFEYDRQFVAIEDTLRFQYPEYHRGTTKLTKIWGFTNPNIYILDSSGRHIIDYAIERGEDSYAITFSNLAATETYYVATDARLKPVEHIEKYEPIDLRSLRNGADYIIISHAKFLDQAQRLAQFRARQGLRTFIADIQAVYDEFSYGIYDPRAIKRFLAYTYANWAPPAPTYILLFGDTSRNYDKLVWDDKENVRKKYATYVPTMMVYTSSWGLTSSDNYFVSVSGDDFLPDMFIGRLPANTETEAKTIVDKILKVEENPPLDNWRNSVCIATGNGDFFEYSAQYLYDNYVPSYIDVSRIATNPNSPYYGSTEELVNVYNNGAAVLNFIGHGGGAVYFDSELFLIEDIDRLSNQDRYPVIFSMTCFVGYFDNPQKPSLGESLLCAADKGVVGHFGSAGKAYLYGDFFLNNALFRLMFEDNRKKLGEVTTFAKLEMMAEARAYWDHVKNYILLGDPATHIALADDIIDVQLSSKSLAAGDVLSVSGQAKDVSAGTIVLSVYNDKDSLVTKQEVSLSNGKFAAQLFALEGSTLSAWGDGGGRGIVRAYFSDGQKDGVGGATFYVLKPAISKVMAEPENPAHNQTFYIFADVEISQLEAKNLGAVRCSWSINKAEWNPLDMQLVSGNTFRTVSPLQFPEYSEVFYKIQAMDRDKQTMLVETPIKSVKIHKRSNLFSRPDNVRIGGAAHVNVLVTISNTGETDAGAFMVRVLDQGSDAQYREIGPSVRAAGLGAQKDTIIAVPWNGDPSGWHRIMIQINPNNEVEESTRLDNTFTTEFTLVTKAGGTDGEYASSDHNASIMVDADGVDRNSSIAWKKLHDDQYHQAVSASNCQKVKLAGSSSWAAYHFAVADSNLTLTKPYRVRFYYDQNDSLTVQAALQGFLRVSAWNSRLSVWTSLKTEIDKNMGYATATVEGSVNTFALLSSQDSTPPRIAVTFEGQKFVDGDYVSQTPGISIIIEDDSGLDMESAAISLALDGRELDREDYAVFQDKQNNKRITCSYSPQLETGEHSLQVSATDIHGNPAMSEVHFSTLGEFGILSIANHPNPFADETIIAFALSEKAETVDVDIYTSSGRRIWSADLADVVGYVELDWDGTDSDGEEIANGVYYLRLCAQRGDEKIEKIEKMAKLR